MFISIPKDSKRGLTDQVKLFLGLGLAVTDAQLSHKEVKNLINDKSIKFDLLLVEACIRPALAFSFVYKAPLIEVSSFGASYGNFEAVGAPIHPLLYPSINRKKNQNLTLWEKIGVIYDEYQIARVNSEFEKLENVMLRKHFGPEIPSVSELWNNVDMLFLNVHPIFEGVRPVPPTVVYMGGIHQKPETTLPADVKSLLDSFKEGVIYISFGTNVDTTLFTSDKVRILVKVLSQLPYIALLKWDTKELPGRTDNIRISKWWPQSDLLRHPNVKLFITQGGLQSTDEAITAGVPLIGIPMFGDQWLNVERYVHHKIGVRVDMETLTEEDLKNAITTVIGDDSYRRNIVNLRKIIHDQPQTPLERAIWWTEHVLRHGGARHLRSPAANISWAEYLELELVLTLLIGLFVTISILVFEKVRIFVKVLSQLPYTVLLKWHAKVLPGRPDNIKISKWWPQSDLLKHPNIKLFITQGGLQSTEEAITAGVPLIGIPMFGDQWLNVERYVHHKIGIKLDMETLTEDDLRNAITTVIGDDSYRCNIVKLRSLIQDQPKTPLERAVWWTEHVLRHGGAKHLRSPAANVSWAEYLELEVVLTLLIALLALAKRGHEVTVVTPDPVFKNGGAPPNLTEIDVHDISYNIWQENFIKAASKGKKDDLLAQMDVILTTFTEVLDAQIQSEQVQKIIHDKSKKFDLLFLEACVRPALAFSYVFKNVPVILVSSLGATPGNYDLIGAADHPILYPSAVRQRLHNLSLWEKITELYNHYKMVKLYENNQILENKVLRKNFGPEIPPVEELENNVDMLFLNVNPIFEGIRPVPPSVIYMGGLHQKPQKELPTDMKSYLDSSKNGVIYISFGTNVDPSMLPPDRIQLLVNVFSQLPYDVLWKWNNDELPGRTENIRISKWLPQSDLLRHPKVKLFITQGGLQSTDEAITAGVPLIGVPMLADQWFNVEKYLYHKIGLRVDLDTVTEEQFKNAVTTVIEDSSYRRNIEKLRSVIKDEPMPPLERAVWWTEHVLRHGAKHLRAPAANMSWADHQVVFRSLTEELVKRGHEITVVTTDPVFKNGEAPANLTEIDVHDISYKIWQENIIKAASKGNKHDTHSLMNAMLVVSAALIDAQIQSKEVQDIINDKSKKFDLLFLEACIRPALAFSFVFKNVPVILVSSLGGAPGNYRLIGAADHPILYPSVLRQKLYNLSYWDKITELYSHYKMVKLYEKNTILENKVLRKKFGPDIPPVEELENNVDMLFLNVHPIFEGIRPVPPSVIYMGGLHQKPPKELPIDLKSYLDSSKNGVIYISFGTNVDPSMLPPHRVQVLLNVFSQLPYDVLWKWNKDELPGRSENIRISKWLPQSDLLRHPKVKLFITQGGLQSTDEAITAGVPLIGVPMMTDQWFNTEKYVYHKIGLRLDLGALTEEQFKNAITTVIEDGSYRRNIEKLRNLMEDEPMRPLERAVWWTEYVLRHGGARHLRSPAANMTWTEYLELELELARRGHELTIVTPDPVFKNGGAPPNLTEIDVHDISYNLWNENVVKATSKGSKYDLHPQMDIILATFAMVLDAQIQSEEVQKMINDKTKQFDLIFLEALVRPALAFSYVYKNVPVILVSSLGAAHGNYDLIGAADHPILYPFMMRQKIHNLSLWDKISELYHQYKIMKLYKKNEKLENKILRKHFGPDIPTVRELEKNVDMLFLNIHPIFEGIRPVPPSVVYMGGLHQKPPKELPTDIKSYLDSSKNGVIYISFGTNVDPSILPPDRIQIFVKVFSQLPYDVLWKWNKDELPGRSENIRISKWLPQSDLLSKLTLDHY
ncbi:hypothetical protein PYW07_010542 [Mythimna separata]|uniref:Erythromycin biosynthesis protein CIII-like C-terminal domain-containing protein n=1 Tax=Mythimna separata TaxID=271217 RepID=A0AAD8DLJ9_MYTSE|nr:hypothetical protein PYW07_010542 [Mythimna separata]